MSSSSPQVVWVQKWKNLKILHGRHTGIVDWHLGIRLGLSVARRRRTHTRKLVPFCTRSLRLHRRIRAGSMTQEPNSWHSLAPLGYPSDPKNHREPFLLAGASCPHPVFVHSRPRLLFPHPRLSSACSSPVVYRSSATQKGPVVPGIKWRVWEKRKVFALLSIRRPRFCAHLVNDDPLLYLANVCHSSQSA